MNDYEKYSGILGQIGETIVSNYLISQGFKVYKSTDYYDSQKDLIVNGRTVEIKTKQPYVNKNAFSIKIHHLKKCLSVDDLYFVSVPPIFKLDYKWAGYIFLANPKEMQYQNYTTRSGYEMIAIPIEQTAIKVCTKIADKDIAQLNKYAQKENGN